MGQGKKHFVEEVITLQNDDEVVARNLSISRLKEFHKTFKKWTEHVEKTKRLYEGFVEEAEKKADEWFEKELKKHPDDSEDLEKKRSDKMDKIVNEMVRDYEDSVNEDDELTFSDVAAECALVALQSWKIRNAKGVTVDNSKIDIDYVNENLDMMTVEKILEIAGAMSIGDVSEGKARG